MKELKYIIKYVTYNIIVIGILCPIILNPKQATCNCFL